MQNSNSLLKQWQAFIEITKNIKKVGNSKKSIQNIIEVVIDTIEKVDAGFLLLWNPHHEVLRIEAAVNFKEEFYIQNKLTLGEGISGTVFNTGQTMVLYGENAIKKAMKSMKEPNYQYYLQSSVQDILPKSCLSVPITYQEVKIGVLTLDNFYSNSLFTKEEIGFVEAIATHIAMIITLSQEIREKEQSSQMLKNTLVSHHQLNDIMLNDRGSKQLILTLSKIIEKEIFYFDVEGHFIFTSHPHSTHKAKIVESMNQFIQQFPRDSHDYLVSYPNKSFIHIFKIASSYGITGYLLVIGHDQLLDVYSKLTLSHSTAIMAIEQMKEQKEIDSFIQKRQNIFQQLLEKNAEEVLKSIWETKYYHYFCFLYYKNTSYTEQNYSSLIQRESYYQTKFRSIGNCLFFPQRDSLVILIAIQKSQHYFEKEIHAIFDLDQHEQILIGRSVDHIDQLFLSYKDIEFLNYTNSHRSGQITSYKTLGLNRYLLSISEMEQHYFMQEIIGPIIPISAKSSSNNELLNTLIEYFKQNKNVARTAEVMHIHQNTVYYRIEQIEEKLKIDLNNIQHVANIHAALFLYEHNRKNPQGDD